MIFIFSVTLQNPLGFYNRDTANRECLLTLQKD